MKDKNEVVLNAVRQLKNGGFKATAIKIELEENFHRGWNEEQCISFLMNELSVEGTPVAQMSDHYPRHYHYSLRPKDNPIKFMRFYNDGSVDSELTITVSLENPENIFLLPKIVAAWNKLGSNFSSRSTEGAGLHIALLNSKNCTYPARPRAGDKEKFGNFKKSVSLLLPALYFLATPNERTRYLEYRIPRIRAYDSNQHRETKYSAIGYIKGAVEFRVFDTCYDTPDAILDSVVVIKNCMKYWSNEYKSPGITKDHAIMFGNDRNTNLERLYNSIEHIELLNEGLRRLKPCYYSIKQVKEQRKFKLTQASIKAVKKQVAKDAKLSYKEYLERFNWKIERDYYNNFYYYLSTTPPHDKVTKREKLAAAKRGAIQARERSKLEKQSLSIYIQARIDTWNRDNHNNYPLVAS